MSQLNFSGIILLTGLPGSGKSLYAIDLMERALAMKRPVYACNFDGLNVPGVLDYKDPTRWMDLEPTAVLFVDEAQRFFRTRRGMVDAPEYITAMETIRHDGVTIVLTTQQPTYLDKHLRGLVGRHEHRIEIIPGEVSNVYSFRRTQEDITDGALAAAEFEMWKHPKQHHGKYKSAEVHTKKRIIPKKIIAAAVAALGASAFLAYAFSDGITPSGKGEAQAAPAAGLAAVSAHALDDDDVVMTVESYANVHQPRVASKPWSAPVYDDRSVTADPQVYCMAAVEGENSEGHWGDPGCRCLTEQGTHYQMDQGTCARLARIGPDYNPYRERSDRLQEQPQASSSAESPGVVTALGIGEKAKPARYGQFRDEPQGPDKYEVSTWQ